MCIILHYHNIQIFLGAKQESVTYCRQISAAGSCFRYLLWSFDELHPSDSLTSSALIKGISSSFSFSASSSSNNLNVHSMARNGKTAPLGRLMWRMYSCDAQLQLSRDNCGWKAIESWINSPGFKFGANHQHRGCVWSKGLPPFGTLFVHQLDFSGILPDQRQSASSIP